MLTYPCIPASRFDPYASYKEQYLSSAQIHYKAIYYFYSNSNTDHEDQISRVCLGAYRIYIYADKYSSGLRVYYIPARDQNNAIYLKRKLAQLLLLEDGDTRLYFKVAPDFKTIYDIFTLSPL